MQKINILNGSVKLFSSDATNPFLKVTSIKMELKTINYQLKSTIIKDRSS